MNIKTTSEGKITIVAIEGRVDAKAAPELEENLLQLIKSGRVNISVSLEDIEFIGSSGIGKLMTVARAAQKAGGQIALSSIPVRFKPTFESIWGSNGTTLMEKLLPIFESPDKALKSF